MCKYFLGSCHKINKPLIFLFYFNKTFLFSRPSFVGMLNGENLKEMFSLGHLSRWHGIWLRKRKILFRRGIRHIRWIE